MTTPAHKVIGDIGKPGQLSFDRYPYLKHSTANPDEAQTWDKTLGEYIARKSKHDALTQVNTEKKLSFEEWYSLNEQHTYNNTEYDCMKMAWNAAKEN